MSAQVRNGVRTGEVAPWLLPAVLLGAALGAAVALGDRSGRAGLLLLLAATAAAVALVVVGPRWVLLGAIALDLSLQIDAHLGYDETVEALGALGGLNVSLTSLAVLGLLLLRGWRWAWSGPRPGTSVSPGWRPWRWYSAYVLVVAVSGLVAADAFLATAWILLLAQNLVLLWVLATELRDRSEIQNLVALLLVGLLAQALICLSQVAVPGWSIPGLVPATPEDLTMGDLRRVTGTFGSPNVAGGWFAVMLPLALAVVVSSAPRRHRRLATAAFLLGTLALAASVSRGSILVYGVAAVVLTVLAVRHRWLPLRHAARMAAFVVLVALLLGGSLLSRVTDDGGAAAGRIPLMSITQDMIAANPVLGVGAGNFVVALPEHATPEYGDAWLYVVHNDYLLVWAESGGLALLAYLAFLVGALVAAGRGARRLAGDRWAAPLLAGVMTALVARALHMTLDVFNGRAQTQALMVVVALAWAVLRTTRTSRETDDCTDPSPFTERRHPATVQE